MPILEVGGQRYQIASTEKPIRLLNDDGSEIWSLSPDGDTWAMSEKDKEKKAKP